MQEDWIRWIIASVTTHFNNNKGNINLYFERKDQPSDWAECRIDGPNFRQASQGCYFIYVYVNILVTSYISSDFYNIYRMVGTLMGAFTDICCYRYGDGPMDDGGLFGQLIISPEPGNKIDVIHFGVITPESLFKRSQIETTYRMTYPN